MNRILTPVNSTAPHLQTGMDLRNPDYAEKVGTRHINKLSALKRYDLYIKSPLVSSPKKLKVASFIVDAFKTSPAPNAFSF